MRKYKYTVDETFFEKIDTEEKAYILGLLYADGCNSQSKIILKLAERDRHILEEIKEILHFTGPIRKIENIFCKDKNGKVHKCRNACEIIIHNFIFSRNLKKLGVVERKTKKIRFPFTKIEKKLYNHFLRGVFDGDGSIFKKIPKNRKKYIWGVEIACKNLLFCQDILLLLYDELDILIKNRKSGSIYKMYITKNDDKKSFLNWIYKNSTIFLKRKEQKYLEFLKYYEEFKKNRTSQYKGISLNKKNGKWYFRICLNKQMYTSRWFDTEEEAFLLLKEKREQIKNNGLV